MSEEIKSFTEEEVGRLKKYYEPILDVDVILSWEKQDRMAEMNISVYGSVLTAHERSEDMHKSIIRVVDKLERQLKKYKGRRHGFEHEKMIVEQVEEERE